MEQPGKREAESGQLSVNRREDGSKAMLRPEELVAEIRAKCDGRPFRQSLTVSGDVCRPDDIASTG